MPIVQNGFDQLELNRSRSVKVGDIPPGGTTVLQLFVPTSPVTTLLPPQLPFGTWQRDRFLSLTPRADAQWGCAVGIGIAKVAGLAWDVTSDIKLRSRKAFYILMNADSATSQGGWISYISKQVRDYTCTNMGAVTEIVRETLAYGSRVVGINHLPAVRCRRTGDPERPIIYISKNGREHILREWQVMYFSDLPDPDELAYGGGLCAAERAYPQIIKMAALENYVYEKISGSRPLAIYIVNGIRVDQIEDAIRQAEQDQARVGYTNYMGAVIMATIKPDAAPSVATIPLAELPDGFDALNERARADLIYSNAIGLDPQDLVPLSNTPLGTAAQAKVLHDKAKGKGLILFRQSFVHCINQLVLDSKTKFLFTEVDYEDLMAKARISRERSIVAASRIKAGVTTPPEERQIMVDQHELPLEFIQVDLTSEVSLSDTDKPGVDDREVDPIPPPESIGTTQPLLVPRDTVSQDNQGIAGMSEKALKEEIWSTLIELRSLPSINSLHSGLRPWAQEYIDKMSSATDDMLSGEMSVDAWDALLHIGTETYIMAGFLTGMKSSLDKLTAEELSVMIEVIDKLMAEIDDIVEERDVRVKERVLRSALLIQDAYECGAELL